jgi:3-oxoacyl-[acyl-carrier-protein] synthase-3
LPKEYLTNHDLSKKIDTSDEWISKRSGIKKRHFVSANETTSDLAYFAALKAIESAKLDKNDIDLIIVATTTPDNTFPATAALVQKKLNINAVSFDVQAVCAGFVFAISVAKSMMLDSFYKNCLVIGADTMSKLLDWTDRSTSVLFGDGAGAVVLQKFNTQKFNLDDWGVLSTALFTDGNYYDILKTNGGVSTSKTVGSIEMLGKEVFKHAVEKLSSSLINALKISDKKIDQIDWVVPHQANQRIISAVADKLKINHNKIISTVSEHGNTSAASIPLALDNAVLSNRIVNGNLIAFQAIGGGLSWGASLIRIGQPKIYKK